MNIYSIIDHSFENKNWQEIVVSKLPKDQSLLGWALPVSCMQLCFSWFAGGVNFFFFCFLLYFIFFQLTVILGVMFYWKINYYKVTVVYVSSLESAFYRTSGNVAVITPKRMNNFQTVRLK